MQLLIVPRYQRYNSTLSHVTTIKASDTLAHQPTVWPVPNACAEAYHPGSGSDSCFGLVKPHQHGIAVGQQ